MVFQEHGNISRIDQEVTNMMKMAIMGAGAIANKMAATITKMEKVEAYAIAARDQERAEAFAGQYGFAGIWIL